MKDQFTGSKTSWIAQSSFVGVRQIVHLRTHKRVNFCSGMIFPRNNFLTLNPARFGTGDGLTQETIFVPA